MKPQTNPSKNLVEIFHITTSSLDLILSEGLKTKNQLLKESKNHEYMRSGVFEDHYDTLFFQWYKKGLKPNLFFESSNWVSIDVDPDKTFVYNRELRPYFLSYLPKMDDTDNYDSTQKFKDLRQKYESSKILLSEFIKHSNQFIELQSAIDETKTIIRNPLTSEPLIVNINDERQWYPGYAYFNEILIKTPTLEPSEFKRHNSAK